MKLNEATPYEQVEILRRHKLWLDTNGEKGERADLRGTDLEDCEPDYIDARIYCLEFFNDFEEELGMLGIELEKEREEDAGE